jgi:hypothetical protein
VNGDVIGSGTLTSALVNPPVDAMVFEKPAS